MKKAKSRAKTTTAKTTPNNIKASVKNSSKYFQYNDETLSLELEDFETVKHLDSETQQYVYDSLKKIQIAMTSYNAFIQPLDGMETALIQTLLFFANDLENEILMSLEVLNDLLDHTLDDAYQLEDKAKLFYLRQQIEKLNKEASEIESTFKTSKKQGKKAA